MTNFFLNRGLGIFFLCLLGIALIIGFNMYHNAATQSQRQAEMQVLYKNSLTKDTNCVTCKLPRRASTEIRII
jgi:predicted negative regulator of RcsB-dependent stress response